MNTGYIDVPTTPHFRNFAWNAGLDSSHYYVKFWPNRFTCNQVHVKRDQGLVPLTIDKHSLTCISPTLTSFCLNLIRSSIYNSSNLCVCLWLLFLDNHWSDLIETCQVYCWGPEYVPFQGLILIGQVVPKLWPFIYQTNDRTHCCVGMAVGEEILRYQWQDTLLGVLHPHCLSSIYNSSNLCLFAFSRFEINRRSGSQVMAKLERVPHYGSQRTDFRIVMTYCILIISRFLMRIYR